MLRHPYLVFNCFSSIPQLKRTKEVNSVEKKSESNIEK